VCAAPLDADAGAPTPRAFVIATMRSAPADTSRAYGFDLDGRVDGTPGTCTAAYDFLDATTGDPGIDNQLSLGLPIVGGMLGPDQWDGATQDAIESGAFLVVLEVGVQRDGTCSGELHAYAARTADGAPPSASTACAAARTQVDCEADATSACFWSLAYERCTGIAPRQTFVVDVDLGSVTVGDVRGRFVSAAFDHLPIVPLSHRGPAPFALQGARVAVDRAPTALLNGEIGGSVSVDVVLAWTTTYLGTMLDRPTLESFLSPDLTPDATGAHCADISAGFGFTAIAATLVH
jgi:hypothetical protein